MNPAFQRRCHISEMTMDELWEQARLQRYLTPSSFDEGRFWEAALSSPPSKKEGKG